MTSLSQQRIQSYISARHSHPAWMLLASRRAQLPSPIDGVTADTQDTAQLARDLLRSRSGGFGAKLCIHPKQLATVQAVFTPTPERIDWARRVCEAFAAAGGAAVAVDGQMVDLPVVQRARAVLRDAGLSA